MESKEKVVVCASGYWDVLHVGHIEYLKKAKSLGDTLVVIVNNDNQAKQKKGFSFMPENERCDIMRSLSFVDNVILSIDQDRTVCKTLSLIDPDIFAKGGDTSISMGNIPEKKVCDEQNIKLVDGLGEKIQSSRWLLKKAKMNLEKLDDVYLNSEM
jgi:cytidyltransferase-like protein